ncbi:MAG: mechanosensitive ion channel [Deltaproteobacteria bacterium]|nr:mechanosensitive ion channel [Deltaproteobacteria bacterium]
MIALLLRSFANRCTRAIVTIVTIATLAAALLLVSLPALAGPNDGLPKPAVALDRATPRRAFDGFIHATRSGDYARAAHFLDLRSVPRGQQPIEGPVLAQRLGYVIDRKLNVDIETISDAPDGGAGYQALVVVGTVFVDDEPVPISVARLRFDDGVQRWIVARTTVQSIPELYKEHGARGWEGKLPRWLVEKKVLGVELWQWLALLVAGLSAWLGGWVLGTLLVGVALRVARRTRTPWDDALLGAARGPTRLMIGVAVLWFVDEPLHFSPFIEQLAHRIAFPVLVVAVAWLAMAAIGVGTEWITSRLPSDDLAELKSRGLRTQLAVMRRVTSVILVVVACAVILMQFAFVRSVGVSILASAGLVGVVFGFAAQKSLAGVIAGIQLSITQPIRIADTVVVEGEYGVIEEINLTYVVVKVWDERRLIVPIQKFLDTTFQNWTKVTPELHGPVMLAVDYAIPIEQVREELQRIVRDDARWDGRTCSLLVTDVTDRVVMLRAVVSARSAEDVWDLRCHVREKLVRFVARLEGGKYLAQMRTKPLE